MDVKQHFQDQAVALTQLASEKKQPECYVLCIETTTVHGDSSVLNLKYVIVGVPVDCSNLHTLISLYRSLSLIVLGFGGMCSGDVSISSNED